MCLVTPKGMLAIPRIKGRAQWGVRYSNLNSTDVTLVKKIKFVQKGGKGSVFFNGLLRGFIHHGYDFWEYSEGKITLSIFPEFNQTVKEK